MDKMKIIVSHPTLNANAKAVVAGIFKQKSLYKLYTSIAFPEPVCIVSVKQMFLRTLEDEN
jgi:hypothetical protein